MYLQNRSPDLQAPGATCRWPLWQSCFQRVGVGFSQPPTYRFAPQIVATGASSRNLQKKPRCLRDSVQGSHKRWSLGCVNPATLLPLAAWGQINATYSLIADPCTSEDFVIFPSSDFLLQILIRRTSCNLKLLLKIMSEYTVHCHPSPGRECARARAAPERGESSVCS